MTYKNRMTKPKTNKGTGWYFHGSPIWDKRSNNKAEDRWSTVPKHKLPYLKKGFSDNIDPESGKYFGWSDAGFKDKGLKKRHRAYAQVLIAEALMTMEEDKPCPFCGSFRSVKTHAHVKMGITLRLSGNSISWSTTWKPNV